MKTKKSILLFISFLTASIILSSCKNNENVTYFDANWNETSKENAAYYRLVPKKENHVWHIRDFYISGEKQFVGQTKDSLATIFEGDVTWYFKSGKVESKLRYSNNKIVGKFINVGGLEGSENSVEVGWDEKDLSYFDLPAEAENVKDAGTGRSTKVYDYYYTNTSRVASQHTSNVGYDDNFSFTIYFDREGNEIGRLFYNEASEKWKGKEVVFYETEKQGRNEMNSIKEIITYDEGLVRRIQYFNENEEEIANGRLKNESPYAGSFFREACWFYVVAYYQKGFMVKEVTYNKSYEKLGELSLEDERPYTGVSYNCTSTESYENGKLHGPAIKYFYEGSEDEESKFEYKKGIEHGDYYIYEDVGMLLEKGTYENGKQVGEVWYYHNQEAIEEGDVENYYYLKATVETINEKSVVSEISQFNLDDNDLLKTFRFEANSTDKFTYLDNGFHAIHLKDLNSDGYDDLQIRFNHHTQDVGSSTYYLFDLVSNKYQHVAELDDAYDLEMDASEKTIKASILGEFEDQKIHVTYGFLKNKLIKKLEVEEVYHREKDIRITTQIFPVPVSDYPLLDDKLPPLTFIQESNEQAITSTHQTLNLKSAPFSITLPGTLYKEGSHVFTAKVMGSYDKAVFDIAKVNQKEEETPFFGEYNILARDPNNPQLFLIDGGYDILYYDDSDDDTLIHVKDINEKVSLLRFNVHKVFDGSEVVALSELSKPVYIIIYTDKNENKKINTGEIYYLTINPIESI